MTSKSGDQSKRTDNVDIPAIVPIVSTISGIGVPAGASKSQWGNTFLDRKKFFEKAVLKDEDTSGDQDDIARLSRSSSLYSSRRSLRNSNSSRSPSRVMSPQRYSPTIPTALTPTALTPTINNTTTTTTSGNGTSNGTTVGVMSHETGQKERVSDGFSQSQSDQDDDRNDPRDVEQEIVRHDKKKGNSTVQMDNKGALLLHDRIEIESPSNPDMDVPKLKIHVLDGRRVHKEKDTTDITTDKMATVTSNLQRQTQSKSIQSSSANDADKDLLERITLLMRDKNRLDARLVLVTEENVSLQNGSAAHQKTISNLQDVSKEMMKQKEFLHAENIKLSKALMVAEKKRDSSVLLEQELLANAGELEKKMANVEGLYQTSQDKRQSMQSELGIVTKDRDKLMNENNELGDKLSNEKKIKQKYLTNFKEAQKQIKDLESDIQSLTKEKDMIVNEREKQQRLVNDTQKKLSDKEKRIIMIEKEMDGLRDKNDKLQKDKSSLSVKMDQSVSSSRQLKQQFDEVKWEKQQMEQRMSAIRQNEGNLRTTIDQMVAELDKFSKEVKETIPDIIIEDQSRGEIRPPNTPNHHLKKMKSVTLSVLSELKAVVNEKETLWKKNGTLETQLKSKGTCIKRMERSLEDYKKESEVTQSNLKKKVIDLTESYESKLQKSQEAITVLTKSKSSLQNANNEIQKSLNDLKLQMNKQVDDVQNKLSNEQTRVWEHQLLVGHLLAEKVIVLAQMRVSITVVTEEEKISYEELKLKQTRINEELEQLQEKHESTLATLKSQHEEMKKQKLELKIRLKTEMSMLKEQITQLDKEKNELKSKSLGSAFQPIHPSSAGQTSRKVMFDPIQEKSQKEVFELRHKLKLMETENKRLQDLAQTSTTMMDAGTALRKHTLEMRRRCNFLETEKKSLTDKVHNLHTSLKTLRESKDRMISERLRALQNENISLQDSIRTSETMFNRKLMNAASRFAETLKENDALRHTLGHLQNGLGSIDTLLSGLKQLSTDIQRQEQELATLRASLAGSGSNLIPAMEISERALKTQVEIQSLLSSRMQDEQTSHSLSLGRSLSSGPGALPPVLQLFSNEYISSLGVTGGDKAPPPGRIRSQSQSISSSVPTFILQLREKMSQLHADNMSVYDLIKHGQENLEARQSDVSRLRDKMLTLLLNIGISVKVLRESHDLLHTALNQQTLPIEQVTSIEFLEREVENWQDKVFACEIALKDIETRMQEDYESHNQRFSQLISQILDLKEENSSKRDKLLANEQYINDIEERCLNAENELFKLRKEMESVMQEALKVPDGFQLSSHGGHVSELIRSQNEDLVNLKVLLNSSTYQQNRLQANIESIHRENTILKHQGLETDRHHSKILEELYKERDFLRKMNSQLIGSQLKMEEAGDLLKKIKRSQEGEKELRDFKKLSVELNNVKLATREKDIAISELQHQLENQQLELLKLLQSQSLSATDVMIGSTNPPKLLGHHPQGRSMRPLSANSVDSKRQSRYLITNLDHPKVVTRNSVESTAGAGDFWIRIPASNTGDSILNLNELGTNSTDGRYILGRPVVTDDEGANFTTETNTSTLKHPKSKKKGHRRTASEGSDSLISLMSSGSSASDSKSTKPFNQASTLPRQLAQPKNLKRPGSVDSMCFEGYSPINTPTPAENIPHVKGDVVGHFAQSFSKHIDKMTHQHDDKIEETKPTKLESSLPVKTEKNSVEKNGRGEKFRFRNIRHVFGSKGNVTEKDKGNNNNNSTKGSDATISDDVSRVSKSTPQLLTTFIHDPNKSDETSSSTGSSNQVSRMTSFASTVDRSNSFASTVSTYSELGGESSPYSNFSFDSFSITDSMDNLMMLQDTQRGPFFTPINHPNYTSSSDDESRYTNQTLKRTPATYHKDMQLPIFPSITHHHTTSSCDSDQLLADTIKSGGNIPVHRDESISVSDMDKELTDHEGIGDRIRRLEKKFGKERRSSTGSVTICNHSGSSMEDIKNAGD